MQDNGYPRIRTEADRLQFKAELAACESKNDKLPVILRWSYNDPDLFNSMILGRGPYWIKQRQMCRLVVDHMISMILSGNSLGKSYWLAGIVLWYLYTRPMSIVVTTAPTANQLEKVLWKEIKAAHEKSLYPLGGKITFSPNPLLGLDTKWFASGVSTTKVDKISGDHAEHVLVCVDEASGIAPEIWEGLDSLNYERLVAVGNPIRTDTEFYSFCQKAQRPDSSMGFMKVSSLESPHIDHERSEFGLACKSWIDAMREKYGEGSAWWGPHILADWPDEHTSTLFPRSWLERCCDAPYVPGGRRRIAVDYAEGHGGDQQVILCRDDNGVLDMEWSNTWSPPEFAGKVAAVARRFAVDSRDISWDASGTGSAFHYFLEAEGLVGCKPYKGSYTLHKNAVGLRLRDCAAWACSRRLDPARTLPVTLDEEQGFTSGHHWTPRQAPQVRRQPLPTFAMPEKWHKMLRNEMNEMRYEETSNGKIKIESGEEFRQRLGRSPDFSDAMIQSFAFN